MNLDDLMRQPLAAVRDDGFSDRVSLAITRRRERLTLMLWIAALAALLPPLSLLPLTQASDAMATAFNTVATSPVFALSVGTIVVLWALQPRPFRL